MTACGICADKGIVKVNWEDAPPDFAVCLCRVGLDMRANRNAGREAIPLWHVWCAREQVSHDRVFLLEDVLTPEELADAGFGPVTWEPPPPESRELTLLRMAKAPPRKPRL